MTTFFTKRNYEKKTFKEFKKEKEEMCKNIGVEFMLDNWTEETFIRDLLKEQIIGLKLILQLTEDLHSGKWNEEILNNIRSSITTLKDKYEIE